MRNITEQKHARDQVHQLLDEKVTLLNEVQHRIKNNLNAMTGPAATAALNEAMPCVLTAKRTSSVGLLLNELVTNVMKYAFPHDAGDDPQPAERFIGATVRCLSEMSEICVEDNGLGMSGSFDPENPSGFGRSMVHALAARLGGKPTEKQSARRT